MTQNKEPPSITNKTYFLVPGWDMTSSSAVLGSIVTKPSEPDLAFFRPPVGSWLAAASTTKVSSSPVSFDSSSASSTSSSTSAESSTTTTTTTTTPGLFSAFLSISGLGDDEPAFTYDRKHAVLSYSFCGHRSAELVSPPSPELLRAAVADPRVAELLATAAAADADGSSKVGKVGVGVYMITGIRTVSGAGVKVASSKGNGWLVELRVGSNNIQDDVAVGDGQHETVEEEENSNRVFALQVAQVKVDEGGEVVLCPLDGEASVVQEMLDRNFGEGTYNVTKGFDEVARLSGDREEGCLIVTPSPIFVDPLTAGTRKVGGEHGIWY